MAKMIGRTNGIIKCEYGCCRAFGISHKNKLIEKRREKRREKQNWKRGILF